MTKKTSRKKTSRRKKTSLGLNVPSWVRRLDDHELEEVAVRAFVDRENAIRDGAERCEKCVERLADADGLLHMVEGHLDGRGVRLEKATRMWKRVRMTKRAMTKAVKRVGKLYADAAYECEAREHMTARYERNQFLRGATNGEKVIVKLSGWSKRGKPRSVRGSARTEFEAELQARGRWEQKFGEARDAAPSCRVVVVGTVSGSLVSLGTRYA